jgi:hypothetical protein
METPAMHVRGLAALALALAPLAAACAGAGVGSATPTDTGTEPPATASGASASPSASASESASASPTSEASPLIEDGRNFAFIKKVNATADPPTITYDLAIFLSGDEANEAAKEHGDETPVPNDYYVVNDNPRLRTVPLAADARLVLVDWNHCCTRTVDGVLSDFARAFEEGEITVDGHRYLGNLSSYWLIAKDGVIVRIEEQYTP